VLSLTLVRAELVQQGMASERTSPTKQSDASLPKAAPAETNSHPEACQQFDADDSWMRAFLSRAQPLFVEHQVGDLIEHAADHRLQIIVGEIKTVNGTRCVHWHPFRLGAEYFYPASMIKPLAALAGLHALRGLQAADPRLASFDLDSPVRVEALNGTHIFERRTTTVRDEVRDSLIKSDNDAYNFLYDLAGPTHLNGWWWSAGLPSVHLTHRLSKDVVPGPPTSQHLLVDVHGETVNMVAEPDGGPPLPPIVMPGIVVGPIGPGKVEQAAIKDFSLKNGISLHDMARMVAWVADPRLAPDVRWPGTDADRQFVRGVMNTQTFNWSLFRPLRAGMMEVVDGEDLVYIGKPGKAYGFMDDIAYVESRNTGRALLIGAVLRSEPTVGVNVTSEKHRYEEVGTPFFLALGHALARELLSTRQ
jgi:hypothetical protein